MSDNGHANEIPIGRKACPEMSKSYPAANQLGQALGSVGAIQLCVEAQCAWWINGECAVKAIARNLLAKSRDDT